MHKKRKRKEYAVEWKKKAASEIWSRGFFRQATLSECLRHAYSLKKEGCFKVRVVEIVENILMYL